MRAKRLPLEERVQGMGHNLWEGWQSTKKELPSVVPMGSRQEQSVAALTSSGPGDGIWEIRDGTTPTPYPQKKERRRRSTSTPDAAAHDHRLQEQLPAEEQWRTQNEPGPR